MRPGRCRMPNNSAGDNRSSIRWPGPARRPPKMPGPPPGKVNLGEGGNEAAAGRRLGHLVETGNQSNGKPQCKLAK